MSVVIEASHVSERCRVEMLSEDVFGGAYIRALDATKDMVEVFGFMEGVAYSVALDKCIEPDGNVRQLVVAHHELAELCKAFGEDDVD